MFTPWFVIIVPKVTSPREQIPIKREKYDAALDSEEPAWQGWDGGEEFGSFWISCCTQYASKFGENVSWCLETSLFLRLPSQDGALSLPLLSLLLSFIFFLPPLEDNGMLFWVPDVLCWHSEVVCGIYSAFKCSFDASCPALFVARCVHSFAQPFVGLTD